MLGIGVAEHSGFITTGIRALLNDWLDDAWRLLPQQLGPKGRSFRM